MELEMEYTTQSSKYSGVGYFMNVVLLTMMAELSKTTLTSLSSISKSKDTYPPIQLFRREIVVSDTIDAQKLLSIAYFWCASVFNSLTLKFSKGDARCPFLPRGGGSID